jgi:hypothetical protein
VLDADLEVGGPLFIRHRTNGHGEHAVRREGPIPNYGATLNRSAIDLPQTNVHIARSLLRSGLSVCDVADLLRAYARAIEELIG